MPGYRGGTRGADAWADTGGAWADAGGAWADTGIRGAGPGDMGYRRFATNVPFGWMLANDVT